MCSEPSSKEFIQVVLNHSTDSNRNNNAWLALQILTNIFTFETGKALLSKATL
jgi:hypothetical protein